MALIRRVISGLRNYPPDFGTFFRPSAIPIVRVSSKIAEWNEESLDKYSMGGYHPVRLGDVFNNRYSVIRKLGYGAYATVWLARDMNFQRHIALKILTANAYGNGIKDIFELDILKRIKEADPTHPGHKHVLHLLDDFVHTGPHGNHVCMVFDPMGHDMFLFSNRFVNRKMPIYVVKELARSLLAALDYLHHSCGVIHTDIKPRNILVSINRNAEHVIHNFLWENQPKVVSEDSPRLDYPINSDHLLPDVPDWLTDLNFKLADFGIGQQNPELYHVVGLRRPNYSFTEASWTDSHLTERIQPNCFRAPEVILGAKWDASTDIWNAACVLYELATGKILFSGKLYQEENYEGIDHLGQMIRLFGPFPGDLLGEGKDTKHYFDENGNLLNAPEIPRYTLRQLLKETRPDIVGEKAETFEAFLRAMLQYRPSDRMTARELWHHQWLDSYD